jgi:hypothetical protein
LSPCGAVRCTEHLERAHAMPWYIFDQAGTTRIRLARHLEPLRARAARQASRAAKGDALSDKKAGTSATRLTRHVVALQGPCGASFYPSGSRRCRHCPARLDARNMPRVAWRAARDAFGAQTVSGGSRQPHICRLNFARSQHATAASSWLRREQTTPYLSP